MKKILMLLAFAGVASVASAQQTMTVTEYEVIQVQDKYQVITNPFWSNWFFSVGGGAQVLYGNNDHIGKFRDRDLWPRESVLMSTSMKLQIK